MTGSQAQGDRRFIVGTSGYSFLDWVGPFYPPGTTKSQMFGSYVQAFETVEINYTYYRMPSQRTLAGLARRSPPGFSFWVKANQRTTHEQDESAAEPFLDALAPLTAADKLAGILLQFPQAFHRTVANRKYLARAIDRFAVANLAVEFRHRSWEHPSVDEGLAERGVSLVIPDVPDIRNLYHHRPAATSRVGYLRLHSRKAENWYEGPIDRYDYSYSPAELRQFADDWRAVLDGEADRVYAFFNNCHRGQAAENAEAFRRLVGQIGPATSA